MTEESDRNEQAVREAAFFLWESEGRPEGCALDHWLRASEGEEEKLLDGRSDTNIPALLTEDVPGG